MILLTASTRDRVLVAKLRVAGVYFVVRVDTPQVTGRSDLLYVDLQIVDTSKPEEKAYKATIQVGKGKEAVMKPSIDGKWNAECVEALRRFQAQHAPAAADFPALVVALRTQAQATQ